MAEGNNIQQWRKEENECGEASQPESEGKNSMYIELGKAKIERVRERILVV